MIPTVARNFTDRKAEAIGSLWSKDVRSTTLERIRLTDEADELVRGLSQPLLLGAGLAYILRNIALPLETHDLLVGRMTEVVPDEAEETWTHKVFERWESE